MTRLAIILVLGVAMLACATTGEPSRPPGAAVPKPAGVPATGLLSEVHAARFADESGRERFDVGFHLAAPATVAMRLYDEDDLLVATVRPPAALPEGAHTLTWSATDDHGHAVPRGLYLYTVLAVTKDRRQEIFDLTDASGGRRLAISEDSYDAERQVIRYTLPAPARVRIRIDLRDGGPHMRTLVDWALRGVGPQEEPWDGRDESGEVRLADHPMALVGIRAYSVPDNALVVSGGPKADDAPPKTAAPEREHRPHVGSPVGDYMHAFHTRAVCHEPQFTVEFPSDSPGLGEATPVLSGDVPVRVTLSPEDRAHLVAARFEVAVFADLMSVAEEEEGYSPFTYVIPASTLGPGSHLITVNVLGNDDHIGVVTRRIEVVQ
jgi:hypothetical protein